MFGNETVSVNGVQKRIPLRLPHLLKIKRLDWNGAAQVGFLLFNDKRQFKFNEPEIVVPFLQRWQAEPPQPDVAYLKRYVDEITLDPCDNAHLTPRRRWAEIEKRHSKPIYPAALLQFLNTQCAAIDDTKNYSRGEVFSGTRVLEKDVIRTLLNSGEQNGRTFIKVAVEKNVSALRVREQERRRLQSKAKKRNS